MPTLPPPDAAPRTVARRLGTSVAVLAFYAVLACVHTWPLVTRMADHTLASGDPFVDMWTIHWLVTHFFEANRVFGGNTFHPAEHAVLFTDLTLGTVVLLLPLQPLRLDPVVLYNLALLVTLTFAGWGFHALAFHLTRHRAAAMACGVLAGYASHQTSHAYHVNLLAVGWLALFLLGLELIRSRSGAGPVVLAGVAFSLAAQSSGYYAVIAALLALVFAAVHWREVGSAWRRYALAAVLAVVLTAPYVLAYTSVQRVEGLRRPLVMSEMMAFDPARDLTSNGYLYGSVLGRGGERLFPGLLTLILAAVALRRARREMLFYLVAAALLLVLSIGPYLDPGGLRLPMPYLLLRAVPAFTSMRHPYTFAAVAVMLLAVAAARGWTTLPVARRRPAGLLLVAAAVVETLAPPPSLQTVARGLPAHYAEVLDRLPPGPILELPPFSEDSLLWAARHGQPVLNGQGSAFVPLHTLTLNRLIQNHWIKRTPEDVDSSRPAEYLITKFPVRYLVLPGRSERELRDLAAALNRSRSFRLIGNSSDGGLVYEVRPAQLNGK